MQLSRTLKYSKQSLFCFSFLSLCLYYAIFEARKILRWRGDNFYCFSPLPSFSSYVLFSCVDCFFKIIFLTTVLFMQQFSWFYLQLIWLLIVFLLLSFVKLFWSFSFFPAWLKISKLRQLTKKRLIAFLNKTCLFLLTGGPLCFRYIKADGNVEDLAVLYLFLSSLLHFPVNKSKLQWNLWKIQITPFLSL